MEYGKKTRIGGFDCLKYKKGDMSFIKIGTIMGNWSMEWREDSILYRLFDSDLTEDELKSLNVMIVNSFMVSNFCEADFQHAVLVASSELQERINAEAKPVSDEEDKEILNGLKAEHEAMEELLGTENKE